MKDSCTNEKNFEKFNTQVCQDEVTEQFTIIYPKIVVILVAAIQISANNYDNKKVMWKIVL